LGFFLRAAVLEELLDWFGPILLPPLP
jgi:hypothetical protein